MGETAERALPGRAVQDDERRGGQRTVLRRPVRVSPGETQAVTADLSRGGAFVITGSPPELGSPVRLVFPAARGEVRVQGLVRWVRHASDPESPSRAAGMGIEFMAPGEPSTEEPGQGP